MNIIKKIRKNLKLSRQEFADNIGVALSTMGHYETNYRPPKISVCYNIINLAKTNGIEIQLEDLRPR